ncbi:uncharacterized protein LOC134182629 isoform X2 [Corticium candelabrum]|uniref:uncharacterized protein LOC134182629 isoform X2 n=1 Tax=Corticium candelabrum TaxID=121492 RepID=UPI002E268EA9|nr:uncharacterized protein LOC134182629 isoform X2 [Corticium candelabrum]XP_062506047.1 uncharacterized protein LOC134182629 isoform X2 [Corticium candelabrum]XP_062506048.1 uncharacterized protein LOC134182629 isoform X2 [Corticium candelabrum]
MASTCNFLSHCILSRCLTKEAENVMREGHVLLLSTGDNDDKAEAATLLAYAIQLNEGTEEEVKKLLRQADGWIKMMGEGRGKAEVLSEMGEVLVIRGDYKRANRILQEAATIQRHFLPTKPLGDCSNSLSYGRMSSETRPTNGCFAIIPRVIRNDE